MAKLVNWQMFEKTLREKRLPIFNALDLRRIFGVSKVAATFLLHRYAKRGAIVRIKRGLYTLSSENVPDLYLANKLYEPSYISLEFALSYHGVIPETVYEITSVTSKAPRKFSVFGKQYTYRHIQKNAFTGYSARIQGDVTFFIADAEKAFVDTLYFRLRARAPLIERIDRSKLNLRHALAYAKLFNCPPLIKTIKSV